MADGYLCIHCGWQETEHLYPQYVTERSVDADKHRRYMADEKPYRYAFRSCPGYRDGIRHLKICPGRKYCSGDCKQAAADLEWSAKVEENRMANTVWFMRDRYGQTQLVVLDIGS